MIVRKITTGWVIQKFDTDTGKFISQDFTAGDQCEYEDDDGNPVDSELFEVDGQEAYMPFAMVQPDAIEAADAILKKHGV